MKSPFRILILGGTTEARLLAAQLARDAALDIILSLAGRTRNPIMHPVPTRTGGFGGIDGLAAYLTMQKIDLLIDVTHPYAARISKNGVQAAVQAGVPLLRLERAPWQNVEGDTWQHAKSMEHARDMLGQTPRRAFLALGRQELLPFEGAPQHNYVVRSVDPVDPPLQLPRIDYLTARGPFILEDEIALLKQHRIDIVVSKNSGGMASYGKIAAARHLRLPVIMIARPLAHEPQGDVVTVHSVARAVETVHDRASAFKERDV